MEAVKDLPIEARALLRKAALLANDHDEVDMQALAGAFGVHPRTIDHRIARHRLKPDHWRWKLVNRPYKRRPDAGPGRSWVRSCDVARTEHADPARIAEILEATCRGMGDGRGEIDDPREHGAWAVPRGGKEHRPTRSNAEVVRGYVREWKLIVGRTRPEPGYIARKRLRISEAVSVGYSKCVHRVHLTHRGARA